MRRMILLVVGLGAAGCSSGVTETGYEPHRLGMGDSQRRALYAPKFSPEQAQAQSEREAEGRRRIGGGMGNGPGGL